MLDVVLNLHGYSMETLTLINAFVQYVGIEQILSGLCGA